MNKSVPRNHCIFVIVFSVFSLIINIALFNNPVYYGLILGLLAAIAVLKINGFAINQIVQMIGKGISKNLRVLVVLIFVGMVIGLWKINGVIPTMIYYGFEILNPHIYLLSVFAICSLISMILGTAVGTVSTVGIVLIGIGTGMGVPSEVIAGAVVSGAFLGDRSSPISSVLNLVSGVTETKINSNFRYFFTTMIPGILLSVIFYYIVGRKFSTFEMDNSKIMMFKNILESYYIITPWLLLPPIIIIIFAIFKVPTLYNMGAAVVIGIIFAIMTQGISIIDSFKSALFGYFPIVPQEYYVSLSGGGIYSFKTMLIVLLCATSLNGIFEGTNMIYKIIEPVVDRLKNNKDILFFTVFFSSLVAMLACNQVISVIIPSGLLLRIYKEREMDNKLLARTLSDSGVMLSSIIPWNVAALTPASVMGVSVIDYLPYAFLSYIMPIITLCVIFIYNKEIQFRGRAYDRKICS